MKRVVITGLGIVSCIGNDQSTVVQNLINLNSGISSAKEYEKYTFRSLDHGKPIINFENEIERRQLRFMGDGAAYNYISMKNAIENFNSIKPETSWRSHRNLLFQQWLWFCYQRVSLIND